MRLRLTKKKLLTYTIIIFSIILIALVCYPRSSPAMEYKIVLLSGQKLSVKESAYGYSGYIHRLYLGSGGWISFVCDDPVAGRVVISAVYRGKTFTAYTCKLNSTDSEKYILIESSDIDVIAYQYTDKEQNSWSEYDNNEFDTLVNDSRCKELAIFLIKHDAKHWGNVFEKFMKNNR